MNSDLLTTYLFQQGELPLKGIGVLRMQEQAPEYDVTTNAIAAPHYSLLLDTTEKDPSLQSLMRFCGRAGGQMEDEVFEAYETFIKQLRVQAAQPDGFAWMGLGTFTETDKLNFFPEDVNYLAADAVTASRLSVIQKQAVGTAEIAPLFANGNKNGQLADGENEPYDNPFENDVAAVGEFRWLIGAGILLIAAISLIALRLSGSW